MIKQMDNLLKLQEKYKLPKTHNEIIFKKFILPQIDHLNKHNLNPTAVILGGQPGAGKSNLMKCVNDDSNYNQLIEISVDNYRQYHPEYNIILKNHPELAPQIVAYDANMWATKMREECSNIGINLLLEGTMGKASLVIYQEKELKNKGYKIEYKIIAVKPIISMLSTFNRYVEMKRLGITPRFVTPQAHNIRFDGLVESIKILSNQNNLNVNLYTREVRQSIRGEFTNNFKILKKQPADLFNEFKKQTTLPLTMHEIAYIRKSITNLQKNGIANNILNEAFPHFGEKKHQQIKM